MADLTRKTANIFDYTKQDTANGYVDNAFINMYGATTAENVYAVSEYIEITGQYVSLNVPISLYSPAVCFYDSEKHFISGAMYNSRSTVTEQIPQNAVYIRFTIVKQYASTTMVNLGNTLQPYAPYWQHSLRKLTTATDTITTLPADVYADGNNATVGLKGNMSQTGTPSPDNPIQPQETGERTENLTTVYSPNTSSSGGLNFEAIGDKLRIYGTASTYVQCINTNDIILPSGTYTFSISSSIGNTGFYAQFRSVDGATTYATITNTTTITFNEATTGRIRVVMSATESNPYATDEVISIMINEGSTAKPYEPYGYKIPISSANTTTNVYLGEVQTTRRIKKLVFDGNETWFYRKGEPPNVFFFEMPGLYAVNNCGLCTHYPNQDSGGFAAFEDKHLLVRLSGDNTRSYVAIRDSNFTNRDDFVAYLRQQYAAGTPVTVWYVLATPETGIVNEPIRKIGDYADSVSGIAIPTTTGKDTFDVLTTLKPSEVSLSYTGWHDAEVKEWDGSEWQ